MRRVSSLDDLRVYLATRGLVSAADKILCYIVDVKGRKEY